MLAETIIAFSLLYNTGQPTQLDYPVRYCHWEEAIQETYPDGFYGHELVRDTENLVVLKAKLDGETYYIRFAKTINGCFYLHN